MERIKLSELVGKDVRGKRAITTSPEYYYQYPGGVPVRTLIAVDSYREKYKRTSGPHRTYTWYRVRWERTNDVSDCGYAGYREDCEYPVTVEFVEAGS